MKARLALTTILAFGALTFVACDDDDDPTGGGNEPETFTATLTGPAEVPPVTTDATGSAGFTVTRSTGTPVVTTVAYSATVTGLSGDATVAHIHGPADVNTSADIIVPLTVTATGTSGQIIAGSFTTTGNANVSIDSLVVLLRNGNSYINIHTAANPTGEIRGQIRP